LTHTATRQPAICRVTAHTGLAINGQHLYCAPNPTYAFVKIIEMPMNTETVSFEIPQAILASLKVGNVELARNIRLLAAIAYFRERKLSLGKAAELAGMGRLDFMDVLSDKGLVIFDYDESMVTSELDGVDQLNPST